MNILLFVLFGAICGWLASVIMSTEMVYGAVTDIALGILGSIVGGLLMSILGLPGVTGFNLYSILVAVFGAIVLIWVGRGLNK